LKSDRDGAAAGLAIRLIITAISLGSCEPMAIRGRVATPVSSLMLAIQ
jgi:hypothetical protein